MRIRVLKEALAHLDDRVKVVELYGTWGVLQRRLSDTEYGEPIKGYRLDSIGFIDENGKELGWNDFPDIDIWNVAQLLWWSIPMDCAFHSYLVEDINDVDPEPETSSDEAVWPADSRPY